MKKAIYLFLLFLSGCANQDFPFCCASTGTANVPYTTTYHFELAAGFTNVNGSQNYLGITSQGDLQDLYNAANVSTVPGAGNVSGYVLDFFGNPVANVILQATDINGNVIGEMFYNSLGGIPDFSTTAGTDASGGYTLLNTPPGEVYLTAIQGGRGNRSILSFPNSVSIGGVFVVPIVPPFIGVTGTVSDYVTGSSISTAYITPVGLKGLSVIASGGTYQFPNLGSDSSFLTQGTSSGYLPTYQVIQSEISTIPQGATEVTSQLSLFSQNSLNTALQQTRYGTMNPSNGILIGTAQDPDGTARLYPYLQITDAQGNSLNINPTTGKPRVYYPGTYLDTATGTNIPTYFSFDSTGLVVSYYDVNGNPQTMTCLAGSNITCPPSSFGTVNGQYIAFDLPPETIYFTNNTVDSEETGLELFTGNEVVDIFPGGVTLQNIAMTQMGLGVTTIYEGFFGNVTVANGITPVSNATLFALGNAASLTTADVNGNFNIAQSSNIFLDQTTLTFKVSHPQYLDTYQSVLLGGTFTNLVIYPMSVLNQYLSSAGLSSQYDSTKAILTGMIISNASGRGTEGVALQATDINGNVVGDVRYFDTFGLPTLTQESGKNGGYIFFNLPPGFIQIEVVSPDEAGNALTHVYGGGISIVNINVDSSPPSGLQVTGSTTDLDGTILPNVNLSVMGATTQFTSDGNGNYTEPFSSYSTYSVRARVSQSGSGGIDTYNLFSTVQSNIQNQQLMALTTPKIQAQAANASVTADFSQGMLLGKVTTYGLSAAQPISSYQASPVPDISRQKMVAGLFNGDNEVDLAVTDSTDNTLTILFGAGDGTFSKSAGSPLCMPFGSVLISGQSCSTAAQPVAIQEADVNNDGITDLVVANYGSDSITVLLGTPQGNFVPAAGSPIQLPTGSHPIALALADFNNNTYSDGVTPITDIVVLNSGSNSFSFLAGNGDGTFSSQIYTYSSGGIYPVAMVTNDFNEDGNPDLAIVNAGSSSVSIFLGFGTGNFGPAPQSPLLFPTGSLLAGIDSSDINGDGAPDLVVANKGLSSVSVYLGNGGGVFASAPGSPVSLSASPQFISIRDINADGRPDIVCSLSSGNISISLGLGNGSFSPETLYNAGGNPGNLEVADFNDDTLSDVVAYQMSTGTLVFLAGAAIPVPNVSLAATDLNGNVVGQLFYTNIYGNILVGNQQTDSSGGFLVFNVPPGIKDVHMTYGAAGNRWMISYAGGATVGNISVIPPNLYQIVYSGISADLVGSQIARLVPSVNISVLGTGVTTVSDPSSSAFSFNVDANTAMLIQTQK